MNRLILIEGMIGSGKTTTAANLGKWLADQGDAARVYHEFAEDHPIRTEAVDLLRASLRQGVVQQAVNRGKEPIPATSTYAFGQWGELAERCRNSQQTTILESTFLQNSVMPSFMNDAPLEEVCAVFTKIETQIAPANPLLIYLRPRDIEWAVKRVHKERGEPWSSWNLASVSGYPWAQRRTLNGREAVIALYRAWERIVDELLDPYSSARLLLFDPQDDWEFALKRIYSKVRAWRASTQGPRLYDFR